MIEVENVKKIIKIYKCSILRFLDKNNYKNKLKNLVTVIIGKLLYLIGDKENSLK